jgi:tetratricopeptide (TPR) repeat protein
MQPALPATAYPPFFAPLPRLTGGRLAWCALAVVVALAAAPAAWAQAPAESSNSPVANAQPSSSDMDAELFYQLLIGELQLRNSDPGAAYSMVFDAARRTQRPELFKRAVDIALQSRAGNSALTAARDWALAHPNADEPYRYELQILLALNRVAEVSATLRNLIRLTPADRRNQVIGVIPQTLSRTSDKAAALAAAREALTPSLQDPATAAAAWASIGQMQLEANAPAAAFDSAQKALKAQGDSAAAGLLALALVEQEWAGAHALFTRYLQAAAHGPERTRLALEFVRNLIDQRRHADAMAQLQAVLQAAPNEAEAWLLQGILQNQQRQTDAAEQSLQRYLTLAAELPAEQVQRGQTQAFLQLAQIAEQRKDFVAASAWLDRIENEAALWSAQVRRAQLLARQGRIDDAREWLRKQPERAEGDARRKLVAEAQMLREVGQHQAAFEAYGMAVQRFPNDADLIYEQAMAAEKIGRFDVAERLLREIIAQQPDFHHAYNALGYSLADRNERLPEAKALIQKALETDPKDAYILDSLGWVEFRLGNKTEALRILKDAYQRRPDAEIAAHLGEVHWSLGQREAALAVWREGLLLNPENETLIETLQRLDARP